ncbi:uncharacterized protein LOC131841402 [Achroia grisella]|uniref:uncharacterized protein LOC131841402 n=1 Tax=Achroia grisella TaxID=688607 RepID=UPI0027D2E0A5|nr:uncharacterized protein LOC131841402 [Achroia grisella]
MYFIVIPLLFACATGINTNEFQHYPKYSAATDAQIRFAIENKYDDTGPGSKGQESAYKTYKTLEEALVGYINDPDTKLPEYERYIGTQNLLKSQKFQTFPSNNQDAIKYRTVPYTFNNPGLSKKVLYHDYKPVLRSKTSFSGIRSDPFRIQKIQPVKANPLNLAHYARDGDNARDHHNPHPQYSYSYDVFDRKTGDNKAAQETRDGDKVRGFYSFIDPDGKQRLVEYTADEKRGFEAVVRRTDAE